MAARKNNIFCNTHYRPIHLHPFYKQLGFQKGDYPNAEFYGKYALSIPLYINLKYEDQEKIIKILNNYLK